MYFLFHGETALRKILKFQGETANFREKFSTIPEKKDSWSWRKIKRGDYALPAPWTQYIGSEPAL